MSNSDGFVVLRSGLVLPLAAVQLALDLENRGLHLAVDGEGLAVGPRHRLTDHDRDSIRRWKPHLISLLTEAERVTVQ
jgi:hypothetical protein